MNYAELQKLYPEFKIPSTKHADYYIETLLRAGVATQRPLILMEDFDGHGKSVKMHEILNYFKAQGWDLSSLPKDLAVFDNTGFVGQDFNNWKEDKYYLSIDLIEANWQSFRKIFKLDLPEWSVWTQKTFNLPIALAESKSFRQLVFGNTNPKRLQTAQQVMMVDMMDKMASEYKSKIVSVKSDELILELDLLKDIPFVGEVNKVKATLFQMESVDSFGERVWLKHKINNLGRILSTKMVNVPGNRYFLHLKNLILKEEVGPKDLLFELNNQMAQWVI